MGKNPEWKWVIVGIIISVLSGVGAFVPMLLDFDWSGGEYAALFVGAIICATSIITSALFFFRARNLDEILNGKELLAHFTYTEEEWRAFAKQELADEGEEKKMLFFMVAAIALCMGLLFALIDNEAGMFVLAVMIGLIALVGALAFFVPKLNHSKYMSGKGEAYVGMKGMLIAGFYHDWGTLGSVLEFAEIKEKKVPVIEIHYSSPNRYSRQYNTVRVPIPHGKMGEAKKVEAKLNNETE